MNVENLTFNLTELPSRRATAPMLALVQRLMASSAALSGPQTADFDDVRQWIDDVIGGEDQVLPAFGQDQYWLSTGLGDSVGPLVDTTQFETPGLEG